MELDLYHFPEFDAVEADINYNYDFTRRKLNFSIQRSAKPGFRYEITYELLNCDGVTQKCKEIKVFCKRFDRIIAMKRSYGFRTKPGKHNRKFIRKRMEYKEWEKENEEWEREN